MSISRLGCMQKMNFNIKKTVVRMSHEKDKRSVSFCSSIKQQSLDGPHYFCSTFESVPPSVGILCVAFIIFKASVTTKWVIFTFIGNFEGLISFFIYIISCPKISHQISDTREQKET